MREKVQIKYQKVADSLSMLKEENGEAEGD